MMRGASCSSSETVGGNKGAISRRAEETSLEAAVELLSAARPRRCRRRRVRRREGGAGSLVWRCSGALAAAAVAARVGSSSSGLRGMLGMWQGIKSVCEVHSVGR